MSDPLELLTQRIFDQCMAQREKILEAFIAETGCRPSEAIQCVRQYGEWFVRKMTPKEIEFRNKVETLAQPTSDDLEFEDWFARHKTTMRDIWKTARKEH